MYRAQGSGGAEDRPDTVMVGVAVSSLSARLACEVEADVSREDEVGDLLYEAFSNVGILATSRGVSGDSSEFGEH